MRDETEVHSPSEAATGAKIASIDWQLSLFRLMLLLCVVGALRAATQFDIAESIEAVWNHEPTSLQFATESVNAENRLAACFAAEKGTKPPEFVSACNPNQPPLPEMPAEVAQANILGFLINTLVVSLMVVAVGFLGFRMARDGRLN